MGEELYFIQRRPGVPLSGATVWTYDPTGQLRQECAVLGGGTMAGVQIALQAKSEADEVTERAWRETWIIERGCGQGRLPC